MSTKKNTPKAVSQSLSQKAQQAAEIEFLATAAQTLQGEIDLLRQERVQLAQQLDREVRNLTAERNFWFHLANDFRFHYTHSVVNSRGGDDCRYVSDSIGGGANVRQALKDLLLAPSEPDSKIARNSRHDDKARRSGYGIAQEQGWAEPEKEKGGLVSKGYDVEELASACSAEESAIAASMLKKRQPQRIVNASKAQV